MLRRTANLTTDQWKKNYKSYLEKLPEFRDEVKSLVTDAEKISAISKIDGFISVPMIISLFERIASKNNEEILNEFTLLNPQLKNLPLKKFEEIIKKSLGNEIKNLFEKVVYQLPELEEEFKRLKLKYPSTVSPKVHGLPPADVLKLIIIFFTQEKIDAFVKGILDALNKNKENYRFNSPKLIVLLGNKIFLDCAMELYIQTDKRQTTTNKIALARLMLGFTQITMQTPFIATRYLINHITISQETAVLWQEVGVWLMGLYQRSKTHVPVQDLKDNQVVRDTNGYYPNTHASDEEFRHHYNLCAFDIALLHEALGQMITLKVKASQQQANNQSSAPIEILKTLESNSNGEEKATISNQSQMEEKMQTRPDSATQTDLSEKTPEVNAPQETPQAIVETGTSPKKIEILSNETFSEKNASPNHPPTNSPISQSLKEEGGAIKTAIHFSPDSHSPLFSRKPNLSSYLAVHTYKNDDVKFSHLMTGLQEYTLSSEQVTLLKEFKKTIVANLTAYINNCWFFNRKHHDLVQQKLKEIRASDDPKFPLEKLFELRNEVIALNSVDTKKITTELLISGFTILLNQTPERKIEATRTVGF